MKAQDKIKIAEARLKAAELRVRAADMDTNRAAHIRQAETPAYDGQAEVCVGKAGQIGARAEHLRAEADLITARAESEVQDA